MSQFTDPGERGRRINLLGCILLDQLGNLPLQAVHPRVGMCPGPAQGGFIEPAAVGQRGGVLGQPRTRRDQQSDRELDRIDVIDQVVGFDEFEHLEVVVESGPRSEGDPGWSQGDPRLPAPLDCGGDIVGGVLLVEDLEHCGAE